MAEDRGRGHCGRRRSGGLLSRRARSEAVECHDPGGAHRAPICRSLPKGTGGLEEAGHDRPVDAVDPAAIHDPEGRGPDRDSAGEDKTDCHRYSPDSASRADATPSCLAEVKAGDQVKVLGNQDPDGSVAAEIVYSGAFRQIAATIVSIDAAKGELEVKDLATKKPLSIRITPDTTMKKLPPEVAQMLARRYHGGGRGGGPAGCRRQARRVAAAGSRGRGGGGPGWAAAATGLHARSPAGDAAFRAETEGRHHGLHDRGQRPQPRHGHHAAGRCGTDSHRCADCHPRHHERVEPGGGGEGGGEGN